MTQELKTKNIVSDARNLIWPFVQRLRQQDAVEGIVLLGGLSNTADGNFIDCFSDLDMTVFLNSSISSGVIDIKAFALQNQNLFPAWLPEFQFYIPSISGQFEINIHQLIYSYENQVHVQWNESKKEAYAYSSEIVFDRKGLIKNLIDEKIKYDLDNRKKRLTIIAGQIEWHVLINPERQVVRGRTCCAHDLLNEGVELIVESLYLFNKRYRPHKKWRLEESFLLDWTPVHYRENILNGLLVKDYSCEDVERRVGALRNIIEPMFEKFRQEALIPSEPFYETSVYFDPERQILISTFSDSVVRHLKMRHERFDEKEIKGFINEHLIESFSSLKSVLTHINHETFREGVYRNTIQTLKTLTEPALPIKTSDSLKETVYDNRA